MLALPQTQAAWNRIEAGEKSRSLALDRFCDPGLRDKGQDTRRKNFFHDACGLPSHREKLASWGDFLGAELHLPPDRLLYAQLQSRLIVNMAGGVMENAGLCLDRFGLPYIPGSAVKGCARRMAIQELLEAETPEGPSQKKTAILVQIVLVFGWCEQDWSEERKDGRFVSDFAYACGENGKAVWKPAVEALCSRFGWTIPEKYERTPWETLPNFAGSVAFLPAYPLELKEGKHDGMPLDVPRLGKLELDIVTCHHKQYYSRKKDRDGSLAMPVALDVEEPNPVVFPAVAPGHVFLFSVLPVRRMLPGTDGMELTAKARAWLRTGLETFGLGAKTAAGYGWFDASAPVQQSVSSAVAAVQAERKAEAKRKETERKTRHEQEERRRMADAARKATEGMTAEEKADFDVSQMNDDQFRTRLDVFQKLDAVQQGAIQRALRTRRQDLWVRMKEWAEKGKAKERNRWRPIVQAVYVRAKAAQEKMP